MNRKEHYEVARGELQWVLNTIKGASLIDVKKYIEDRMKMYDKLVEKWYIKGE